MSDKERWTLFLKIVPPEKKKFDTKIELLRWANSQNMGVYRLKKQYRTYVVIDRHPSNPKPTEV